MRAITRSKPAFNKTNEKIEWAKWSWNPITGCLHGCPYCYARDIAIRFNGGFEPKFYPERLTAPATTVIPKGREDEPGIRNVFVCSMADLFGDWMPKEWIEAVLGAVRENPQWTFLFLTKNPKRYAEFEFPENAWLGATADTQTRMDEALRVFATLQTDAPVQFVSCEPLNEPVRIPNCACLDWLIVGGRSKSSGMPAFQPEWQWVEDLLGDARAVGAMVYFKPNLTVQPKEYPHGIK